MKNSNKKGFTLTELVVVLVILTIMMAIAVPLFLNYWKHSEFRKNESYAKTVYLAAESKLTYYRSSGQWEQFKKQVKTQGIVSDSDSSIYAITLDADSYSDTNTKDNAVLKLIDDYTADKDIFNGSIGIEIDLDSGSVYSSFYGTRCKGLIYGDEDADGYLTMSKRDYESRKERLLGYYSAEDMVNTVSLNSKKLRITTISLQNSEKLSLNWSSNVGDSLDVSYEITFYKRGNTTKLFSMVVSPYDLRKNGWSADESSDQCFTKLVLKDKNNTEKGTWDFPLTYSDKKYSLVLDAMMSAEVQALLDSKSGTNKADYEKTLSTSILRLASVASELENPQDIYATVKATSYSGGDQSNPIMQEYKDSEAATSNTSNTLYADATSGNRVKISAFRHLSNIRYYENSESAVFELINKNMDWASVGTGVYALTTVSNQPGISGNIQKLVWKENNRTSTVDFPSIPLLAANHTFKGNGNSTRISHLCLGENSVVDDGTVSNLKRAGQREGSRANAVSEVQYLGLFCEIEGKVDNVTLYNTELLFGEYGLTAGEFSKLKGVGILAGRSQGEITNVSVSGSDTKVIVSLKNIGAAQTNRAAAVGGVVGVFAEDDGSLFKLSKGAVSNVSMSGTIKVELPDTDSTVASKQSMRGIGGIVGYARLNNILGNAKIIECTNRADINGNLFTGGIVGKVDGTYDESQVIPDNEMKEKSDIIDCSNDGLILCSVGKKTGIIDEGSYFGGIVGYGYKSLIYASSSASGQNSKSYSLDRKDELLRGKYVGGIIGYGDKTLLNNCSTKNGGYVLGSDYVGGIAGGLGGLDQAIRANGGVSVTTNGNYVIGNSYVGGIVGENDERVILRDCINNGVAVGYEKYVGGIVGYNHQESMLENCASYLSDYDNSIYETIVNEWKANADYVGGLAGYNDGAIVFDAESEKITVKSVSSITIGKNYVGGIVGFNDVHATFDVGYTLIGGRIYAFGDCAGGAFGFNASVDVLTSELKIRPKSIEGRYFVGGCIGANIINPTKNISINKIHADNILGTITAQGFCGGVIGYQATYVNEQLTQNAGDETVLLEKAEQVLPLIQNNIPVYREISYTNPYEITITTSNNIPLYAQMYTGGIIGYSEKNSHVKLVNCTNSGSITVLDSKTAATVLLGAFIENEVEGAVVSEEAKNVQMHFVGGVVGVNLKDQVIENCTNTGSVSGFTGIGGVVGFNAGSVRQCTLKENFGNAALDYVGGVVGINIGDVEACQTVAGKSLLGNNHLGGIVGWNLDGGSLIGNSSNINITGFGNNIGGIAGRNSGAIQISNNSVSGTIISTKGKNVGGIAGISEKSGTFTFATTSGDIIAVGTNAKITGYENVGGIAGSYQNERQALGDADGGCVLICEAGLVRATHGKVGGIVGETYGDIYNMVNRSVSVTADAGSAGGITALNAGDHAIRHCANYGNVSSNSGYASGIAAENFGEIYDCTVQGTQIKQIKIYSMDVTDSGAICAVNYGVITESWPGANVLLQGSAINYGGIAGKNEGIVKNTVLTFMPDIESSKNALVVGTAVGQNEGSISQIEVGTESTPLKIENFGGYKYLGGIAGSNGHQGINALGVEAYAATNGSNTAQITNCSFFGIMQEKENTSEAGNCYGGITGINYALLEQNTIRQMTMTIQGIYTANSSSTAEQKEIQSTHAGGITGKNETSGQIRNCYLEDNEKTTLTAKSGMIGGVTGFNKGEILLSGSKKTESIMNHVTEGTSVEMLHNLANAQGLSDDANYVNWSNNAQVENLKYSNNRSVTSGRLQIYMTANGNVGGVTAFNGTSGSVNKCVSGDWFLVNKSQSIGVGTGGIIGMNESEKDLNYLVNGAFVGRQLSKGDTNRFAGGIIGNQNNSTTSDWTISKCVNYGTIYCYNSHYSGGIMGQWTGTGGTIENCRNYGNLQTTYATSWVGASAGIVAQLYHAYEGNQYNIISSSNYGNIYKTSGVSGNGANDSAGILGNITTYKAGNEGEAQNFTVRILDCLNAPEVEIYSSSMASGIFGFLSCDNANEADIKRSTCNVRIEIERCRNFAKKLNGAPFVGGIFGARYSATGWSNTVIKDCYSPNLGNASYNYANNPIFSNGNKNDGTPGNIENLDNRRNNIYFDATNGAGYFGSYFKIGIAYEDGTRVAGNGVTQTISLKTNTYWNQYIDYTRVIQGMDNRYYFVYLRSDLLTLNSADYYIDRRDGGIKDNYDQVVGQVLFYTENERYGNHDNMYYIVVEVQDNEVMQNSRESYRRLEGINDQQQMLNPKSVEAEISGGKIHVKITPQEFASPLGMQVSDPFKYEVIITDGVSEQVKTLYDEEGSFDIPSGMSGTLNIYVRSVSMFADVSASDSIQANVEQNKQILPTPDVRAELIVHHFGGGNRDYRYEYSLNNLEAYEAYPGWQVKVQLKGYTQTAILNAENPKGIINLGFGEGGLNKRYSDDNFYQIVATATSDGTYQDSATSSTAAYLPYYRASIPLQDDFKANQTDNSATPNVTITGESLEELSINVALDNSSTSLIKQVQPIYRVELLGTWKGRTDVVLAKTDVMAVSQGIATATLTNLPDYIREASDLHVRIWYAQSGLGPVYMYHDSDVSDSQDTTEIKELVSVDENGNETWLYTHNVLFEVNKYNWTGDFPAFIYDPKTTILTWLPAPELDQADGIKLEPTYDADNHMLYTFSWDRDVQVTENPQYELELTGIDAGGREVTIDTSSYVGGKFFTIDGDDWNFTNVRLKVTRVGDANQKQLGLSSTATYKVSQRLEKPGQPSVVNSDRNELNYTVSWAPISDETYCSGYQIYLCKYDDEGNLGAEELIGIASTGEKVDGIYSKTVDLEEYAGKRIVIYLVAKTQMSNIFVDSALGVTYELEIPTRLDTPTNLVWNKNWEHDVQNPVDAANFAAGNSNSIQVRITADAASVPPGDSAYLLKAYVYDSEADAHAATVTEPGNYSYIYPRSYGENKVPIQMDVENEFNYYHYMSDFSIRYAGKWIVYYARISSGNGYISSHWVKASEPMQLPFVRLATPEVSSDTTLKKMTVTINDTPNMPEHEEEWTAEHTVLNWRSVECAEVYSIDLLGEVKQPESGVQTETITGKLRVVETTQIVDGVEKQQVNVQQYVQRKVSTDTERWEWVWENVNEQEHDVENETLLEKWTHTFELDIYNVHVESNYVTAANIYSYYSLTLKPELIAVEKSSGGFDYTLKLPDVTSMKDMDRTVVENDKFNVTQKAAFQANVRVNVSDEETDSDAYVASATAEIEWR